MCAMAESSRCSSSMARTRSDSLSLKEAIQTQQKLLQKLYCELEEEREASATAASEALSMILRVQEEKAAVTMEASQYKRMTEEKMHHVERSLMLFKEMMYHKEMQIASLECQVQSYKYKMLSMGCGDSLAEEMGFGDNRFFQRNEAQIGNSGLNGNVRRMSSLPAVQFQELCSSKATVEIEGSVFPLEDMCPYKIDREPSRAFDIHNQDIDSYWEQIRHLDERVDELSRVNDVDHGVDSDIGSSYRVLRSTIEICSEGLENDSRTCSVQSEGNTESFYKPIIESLDSIHFDPERTLSGSSFQTEDPANRLEFGGEGTRHASDSIGVQDIFEVPQTHEIHKILESQKREEQKRLKGDKRLVKPDSTSEGISECYSKDEAELVKKVLLHSNPKNKLSIPSDGVAIGCHIAVANPTTGFSQSQTDVEQLNKRLEQLEGERKISYHKDVSDRWEEELRLLKEIHEKLEKVQAELRSSKAKKRPPLDDPSLVSIMEEMWMFSL